MRVRIRLLLINATALVITCAGCALLSGLDDLRGEAEGSGDSGGGGGGNVDGAADGPVGTDSSTIVDGAVEDTYVPPLPDGGCSNNGGPQPVRVGDVNVSFCIDSTEVTRGQYVVFLASGPKLTDLPPVCSSWKTGFIPGGPWPPTTADDEQLPASNVDWCDAIAFCKWAGKHLCGKIGGGPVADPRDVNISEWLYACSKAGTRIYPYGNTWDPIACNGSDLAANKALNVGTLPKCVGGWDGIFDMSGNLHELLDSCKPAADAGPVTDDRCGMSGSAYDGHGENDLKCGSIGDWKRGQRHPAVGFRCCSN